MTLRITITAWLSALVAGYALGWATHPTHHPPHCTTGASSITTNRHAHTDWHPKGCAIYPQ
jgi:hypothetical protein